MKLKKNIFKLLFVLFTFVGAHTLSAQSCKQAFYRAKEQYNGGQFESAQNLLNTCINSFNSTSNQNQVFKVYKLYIASCAENRDTACANKKRQQLIKLFSEKYGSDTAVIEKLNNTSF